MNIVSLTTESELLIESESTLSVLNFSLSEAPPPEGITLTINASNLAEFNLTQTQVTGGEITLEAELIASLQKALDETRITDTPGASIAIVSPFGSWFGVSGVANIEDNIPLQTGDRFEAGSITKTFTATTLLQLVEEDVLALEDTLTDWLPATVTANVPNAEEITLKQLLQHTSGIANYTDVLFDRAMTNPLVFAQDWEPEQLVELVNGLEPLFEPGTSFTYSNSNFLLAGMIIESATGNNIATEIRERIIDPLGLDNTFFAEEEEIPGGYVGAYWDFDNDGTLNETSSISNLSWAWSAGAIISNTKDLDTFARNLFAGDLLQPDTLNMMLDTIPAIDNPNYSSYGLGVGTIEDPNRFLMQSLMGETPALDSSFKSGNPPNGLSRKTALHRLWYIHRGLTLGHRSNMWYSPQEDLTYIELINGFSRDNLVADILPVFREGITDNVFNFTITEQEGTIIIPVLNDGETEGEETVTFTLESATGAEIDLDNSIGEFTIVDTAEAIISFNVEPELLIESQATVASLNFNLDGILPPSGATVTVNSAELSEFNLDLIQTEGGEISLSDNTTSQLEDLLAAKVSNSAVPGAAIAVSTPLGNWSEVTGIANIEDNIPLQKGDKFEIGSVTKSFVAATVLKLVEAGTLTLEDTLTDWLPEAITANIPNSDQITIKQLLNHTSGIAEYNTRLLFQAAANPALVSRDWQPEELLEFINGASPSFAPGESWRYSGTNYILAGMVIEAATGNNIATEIRTNVLNPLNLENTFFAEEETIPGGYIKGYFDFDRDGILDDISVTNLSWAWTTGAIVSNSADLTRYAQGLYGGELLSEASLEEMLTFVDTGVGFSYGLGTISFDTPNLGRVIGHNGGNIGFQSNMWYAAEDNFTYVDLINGRSSESFTGSTIPSFRDGVISEIGNVSAYDEFNFTLTDTEASITIPVLNDGEVEGAETATFAIEPGTGYEVNPDANSGEFTILDVEKNVEPPNTVLEPIFGSLNADTIEIRDSNQLIFTGDADDLIDLSLSKDNNRIYAGSGDDTLILGAKDRIFGNEGDDRFFATSGGDNTITGGAGADQFWLASAELPNTANIITDFTLDEDILGIAGLNIGFDDLNFNQNGLDTIIKIGETDLAVLINTNITEINNSDNFTFA